MDYLSAAISAATSEQENTNFKFDNTRILSVDKTLPDDIKIMSDTITEMNIPRVPNIGTLGKQTIQNSKMQTILDYDNYQLIINIIKGENKKKYGSNWALVPIDKSFLHTELLGHAYTISTILVQGRIDSKTQWDLIQNSMLDIFKILISLTIKNNNEIPLYSILTAHQTLFDNAPGSKIELFDKTFWDMFLIPLMLKQDQLLGIKFMEFWAYLGIDFNALFGLIIDEKEEC